MKAKEKAKSLVDSFRLTILKREYNVTGLQILPLAKKCALISVDECIKEHCHESENKNPVAQDRWIQFWTDVKSEINLL
jgi:hypothetical protein